MRLEPTDEHKLGLIPLVVSARPPVRRRPGFGRAAADGFRPKPTPGDARRSADQLTVAAITRSGGGAAGTCRQREGRFALIIGDGRLLRLARLCELLDRGVGRVANEILVA
jgi:hypothetical protein